MAVLLDADARDEAIERLMKERGLTKGKAASEIKRRVKDIKCIIALWGYRSWARENAELHQGPVLNSVNYTRVQEVLGAKCYGQPGAALQMTVWDLVDLSNKRLFDKYADQLLVPFSLQEILLLNQREWDALKLARPSLVTQRKKTT